jgi:hypothetical protein
MGIESSICQSSFDSQIPKPEKIRECKPCKPCQPCQPSPPYHPHTTPQHLKSPDAIRKVIYIDAQVDWNVPSNTVKAAVDSGFNVILFAFYLEEGPFDFLLVWSRMSREQQAELVEYAHERGAILGLSAGGSTSFPYGLGPVEYATRISTFAIENQLDLVDYDLEGIQPNFTVPNNPDLYAWMKKLNDTTRSILGDTRYITHTPQAPYLSAPNTPQSWCGPRGGYYEVYLESPFLSWLNIQFYNQGEGYKTYETVWIDSGPMFPGSAISQVWNDNKGIPLDKIIYGSYLLPSDGSGGIYDPQRIHDAFIQARTQLGWASGSMIWQWQTQGIISPAQWLNIVYQEPLYYTVSSPKGKSMVDRQEKQKEQEMIILVEKEKDEEKEKNKKDKLIASDSLLNNVKQLITYYEHSKMVYPRPMEY